MEGIASIIVVTIVAVLFWRPMKNILEMSGDMAHDEFNQTRKQQIIRHARDDVKTSAILEELMSETKVTALDIIKLRKENKI